MYLTLSMTFLAMAASAIAIRAESDDVIEGEISRAAFGRPFNTAEEGFAWRKKYLMLRPVQNEVNEFLRKLDSGECSKNNPTPCCSHCALCLKCKTCGLVEIKDLCKMCTHCPSICKRELCTEKE